MKKTLFLIALQCFALASQGQTPGDGPVPGCRILSLDKPKPNQAETAFCKTCAYWPGGIVPYEFDANLPQARRNDMLSAMSRLEGIANLNFVQRNGEAGFIFIKQSDKPYNYSSDVGRTGGRQEIGITSWNNSMIICHELMHAIGFWHEQSRPDRETYVAVNYANMCPGSESQFDVAETGATSNIPYDFLSIMHYGGLSFAKCLNANEDCNQSCPGGFIGKTLEIQPAYQNGQNFIGNRSYLSQTDSLMLRFTYPFSTDRFVNLQYNGPTQPGNGLAIQSALSAFSAHPILQAKIPDGSDVWIMPGTFNSAEGTYSKRMTLRAPFGGVVLK